MKPANVGYLKEGLLALKISNVGKGKIGDMKWLVENDSIKDEPNWFLHYDIYDFKGCDPSKYEMYLIDVEDYDEFEDSILSILVEKDSNNVEVTADNEFIVFKSIFENASISHATDQMEVVVPYSKVTKTEIVARTEETIPDTDEHIFI